MSLFWGNLRTMAISVSLGPRDFPSKSIAKTYISTEILHHYPIGDPITDPEHIAVLMDVLRMKDNADEKIGSGIDYFYVDRTSRFENYVAADARTFVIRHTDPAEEDVDFGYTRVIDGGGHVAAVKDALRHEALAQRDAFKFSHFSGGGTVYDVAGEPMTGHEEAEVRYGSPSWGALTYAFVKEQGGWAAIQTTSGDGEAQVGRRLTDASVRDAWIAYYEANADPELWKKRSV